MKFTGYRQGWNRCECGQKLLKIGEVLKHRPNTLKSHNLVLSKKNNKDRWNVCRIYKGIDSIVDVDGTFKDKNGKEIEVKN